LWLGLSHDLSPSWLGPLSFTEISLSDHQTTITLIRTVAASLFDVCLLFVGRWRWRKPFQILAIKARGAPPKMLGRLCAIPTRKFILKILDPSRIETVEVLLI
jgi:hypothetical protein